MAPARMMGVAAGLVGATGEPEAGGAGGGAGTVDGAGAGPGVKMLVVGTAVGLVKGPLVTVTVWLGVAV